MREATKEILIKAGIELSGVAALSADELLAIKGIGPVRLAEIQRWIIDNTVAVEQPESKLDKRAKMLLKDKATALTELLVHWMGKQQDVSMALLKQTPKHTKPHNHGVTEYIAQKYISLKSEHQVEIVESILKTIFRHQVNTGTDDIIESSLISTAARPIETLVHTEVITSWKLRKSLDNILGDVGPNKGYLLGMQLVSLLLEVMTKINVIDNYLGTLNSGKTIHKIVIKSKEVRLSPTTDANLIKWLEKQVGTEMQTYTQKYTNEHDRLADGTSMYAGHSAKANAGSTQHQTVLNVLNKKQNTGYMLNKYLTDVEHPLGQEFLQLSMEQLENESSRQEFLRLVSTYEQEVLYHTVSIVPDNGRIIYNGFPIGAHNGGVAWILEYANKELITDETAQVLRDEIADLESKGKIKRKDKMMRLHYKAALLDYENNEPSGCMVSRDFKASGPLCQSLMMHDKDGINRSMAIDGQMLEGHYEAVLAALEGADALEEIKESLRKDHTEEQLHTTLRQIVKAQFQPLQYGSSMATAMQKALDDEGYTIPEDSFKQAFKKALPKHFAFLSTLQHWSKQLTKHIKNNMNPVYRLDYYNAFGTKCTITPLSKDFEYKFNQINRRDITVPCKIVDPEEFSVKIVAAASHQLDASILFLINSLFEGDLTDVHDDFRPHVNYHTKIQEVAKQALELLWNKDTVLSNYLGQVLACLPTGSYSPGLVTERPELDWSTVTDTLH